MYNCKCICVRVYAKILENFEATEEYLKYIFLIKSMYLKNISGLTFFGISECLVFDIFKRIKTPILQLTVISLDREYVGFIIPCVTCLITRQHVCILVLSVRLSVC